MRTTRAVIALTTAGLLALAAAVPVSAGSDSGKASGWVRWEGEGGNRPGRTSAFRVTDGSPGAKSDVGDSGWYAFSEAGTGSLTLDVHCVRVDGDWSEFAGTVTAATGPYTVDEVFLVSVFDSGERGTHGDEIGMKSKANIKKGCKAALNSTQFGRKGIITGGNIKVRDPR